MKTEEYLKWGTLKKICKEWQNNNPDINPMKLYDLLINDDNFNIPPKTMLHQIYKEYKSMKDLFIIGM